MCRQTVHLYKHFKWFEKSGVLKLCRRFTKELLSVFLHHDKYTVIVLRLFYERFHIILSHPSTENIIFVLIFIHSRRHLTDIEVIYHFLQTLYRSDKLCCMPLNKLCYRLFRIFDLFLCLPDLFADHFTGHSRCSNILIRNMDSFKMKRTEGRIYFTDIRVCCKVTSEYIIFISFSFQEDCIQIIKKIFLQLAVGIRRNPSEPYVHIPVLHDLMQIQLQRTERLQYIYLLLQFITFLFQKLPFLHKFQIIMVNISKKCQHLFLSH